MQISHIAVVLFLIAFAIPGSSGTLLGTTAALAANHGSATELLVVLADPVSGRVFVSNDFRDNEVTLSPLPSALGSAYGHAVAAAYDTSDVPYVFVAAPLHATEGKSSAGQLKMFSADASDSWKEIGALQSPVVEENALFGFSVATAQDASLVAVGAPGMQANAGGVVVFRALAPAQTSDLAAYKVSAVLTTATVRAALDGESSSRRVFSMLGSSVAVDGTSVFAALHERSDFNGDLAHLAQFVFDSAGANLVSTTVATVPAEWSRMIQSISASASFVALGVHYNGNLRDTVAVVFHRPTATTLATTTPQRLAAPTGQRTSVWRASTLSGGGGGGDGALEPAFSLNIAALQNTQRVVSVSGTTVTVALRAKSTVNTTSRGIASTSAGDNLPAVLEYTCGVSSGACALSRELVIANASSRAVDVAQHALVTHLGVAPVTVYVRAGNPTPALYVEASPQNGGWCAYTLDACAVPPLNSGARTQSRVCACPPPLFGGADCTGTASSAASASEPLCKEYAWNVGAWGACVTTDICLGTKERTVECRDVSDNSVVAITLCNPATRPDSSQACELFTYTWQVDDYSPSCVQGTPGSAVVTCGTGNNWRNVYCSRCDAVDVSSSFCFTAHSNGQLGARPAEARQCSSYTYYWSPGGWGGWGTCSGSTTTRTRAVPCLRCDNQGASDSQCGGGRPTTTDSTTCEYVATNAAAFKDGCAAGWQTIFPDTRVGCEGDYIAACIQTGYVPPGASRVATAIFVGYQVSIVHDTTSSPLSYCYIGCAYGRLC